jgi:DNA-binding response OmpR family regulator
MQIETEPGGSRLSLKGVLVIEDDLSTCELLKFYLVEEGYDVQICSTGEALRKYLQTAKPDLITLDILLPDENGLDLLREIRSAESTRDIPVIMVSIKEDDKEEALAAGALAFLGKPLDEQRLKSTINEILAE